MALIVVLSVLAVLALLVTAFATIMRGERLAAHNYADRVRARHLLDVALAEALDAIDRNLRGCTYFYASYQAPDATASRGAGSGADLLAGEAAGLVPRALWDDTAYVSSNVCAWTNIVAGGRTNARVAYIVVNCSGLLDANAVGGLPRGQGADPREIDLSALPDMLSTNDFLNLRRQDRRYETVAELSALNTGLTEPVSNLFVFSHDPNPDVYFTNETALGWEGIGLRDKFRANELPAVTNPAPCDCYSADPVFMTGYFARATGLLARAGFSNNAADVAWNLVNYLDGDRLPRNADPYPYREHAGSEAVPLINEIAVQPAAAGTGAAYEVAVELWFPFYPATVAPGDGFSLQVGVFTNLVTDAPETSVMSRADTNFSFGADVANMAFGTSAEFLCFTSAPIRFPSNSLLGAANPLDPGAVNDLYVLARVLKDEGGLPVVVDEAMGYAMGDDGSNGRRLLRFTNTAAYAVQDPRINGRTFYWEAQPPTPGAMNAHCDPWSWGAQGLPLYHADGPLRTAGDLGYVFRAHPQSASSNDAAWCSIEILEAERGARLLDWVTARGTGTSARGLVRMETLQEEARRALFEGVYIGHTNTPVSLRRRLTRSDIDAIDYAVQLAINRDEPSIGGLFGWIGRGLRTAGWQPGGVIDSAELREDALRATVGLLSNRQGLFTVILAAQTLAPDGRTVTASDRAAAIVWRDAYTGRHFVRLFTRL